MPQIVTNDLKPGMKVEAEGHPYTIVTNTFTKPGKGQPFNRVKLKNLLTGRVIERTYKSGDKLDIADVQETQMRLLYKEQDQAFFMDEASYEQIAISLENIGETVQWLLDDQLYSIVFYKGNPINVEPPTFVDLKIVETAPGVRGDTASGRVMKTAITQTGNKVQVPIFIEQDEIVRFDTRTGDYVSRVSK
ncbi:MAG: elongation factor P [Parachlamydiales bacterium]|nr:elongation factor P [Parachlamydiales bacterium]